MSTENLNFKMYKNMSRFVRVLFVKQSSTNTFYGQNKDKSRNELKQGRFVEPNCWRCVLVLKNLIGKWNAITLAIFCSTPMMLLPVIFEASDSFIILLLVFVPFYSCCSFGEYIFWNLIKTICVFGSHSHDYEMDIV